MISTPGISIIVPAYNNPVELDQCLHSLQQSELRTRSEIIVIDDCSPEAGEAMERVAQKYDARFYRQTENAGPGVARNRGALEARGSILVFIDSDCIAPAGWVSRLIQPIYEGMCLATTACYCGPVAPTWITIFQDEDYRYRMPSTESDASFVNSCNFAVDRNAFLNCGGFPEQRISEDMVLGLMLAEQGTPARFLPDAGVRHGYCPDIDSYLKQRFSFAYNTVRSYFGRTQIRSRHASSGVRSFNPLRTVSGMFFVSAAILSLILAGITTFLDFDVAGAFWVGCLVSLLLETLVHGRFLIFLTRRKGLMRAISYTFLLYLIDVVYVMAVLKAIINTASTKG